MERSVNYTEAEIEPLKELRIKAREVTDEEKYLSDDNLIRALRARDLHVQAAFEMWVKWMDWRKTYRADCITEEEMMPHIISGKAYFHGEDLKGRPCLIVRARYHWPEQFTVEETMRYVIYIVEQGVKLADEKGVGQICVLYDRAEVTPANKDGKFIEMMKSLSAMLQDFYAERLGAIYVLHINWFYWLIFQAVKPMLQKKTREKMNVLRNTSSLKDYFSPSQLLVEYEGEDPYVHPYPALFN